jgi:hypothetical protein
MDINSLHSFVLELGLKAEDLDELIHDVASEHASRINNEGIESQLKYLADELGWVDAGEQIAMLGVKHPN